jgi:lipid II:glycine glycyltransferase (peptidoglycan interpeptide bridge formation enzyme)
MEARIFENFRKMYPKNLWQSLTWANLQKSLGNNIYFFGDNEALALGIQRKLPFNFTYLEIPRGPLGKSDKSFWEEIKKTKFKQKPVFVSISPQEKDQEIKCLNFKSRISNFPENTLILDLTQSEEELLRQMKPKGRYNIRLAQRHKIKIEESDNLEVFYDILLKTTKRDGFVGHNYEYYQKFLKELSPYAKLYLAYLEDGEEKIYLAGGIFVFFEETVYYYYGSSLRDKEYRDKMAPYLLQWELIMEAKKQGKKIYDFLGIAPNNNKKDSLFGVTRFKKQFGGKIVSYLPTQDIVLRPCFYFLYRLYHFFKSKLNFL